MHFNRPRDQTKPEQVLSTKTKESAVSMAISQGAECEEDIITLMRIVSILRKHIETAPKWRFDGCFDGYHDPPLLLWFCKHLIKGNGSVKTDRRNLSVSIGVRVLAQHIVQAYRWKSNIRIS